jgi:hypothetical protein
VDQVAVLPDGRRVPVPPPPTTAESPVGTTDDPPEPPGGPSRRVPLGRIAGARSGDKGGTANIGVWVRSDDAYAWLLRELHPDRLRELLPETADHPIRRYRLDGLRAVNFVIDGLLGEGVGASTRFDPQGKALGEWLRSRYVDLPEALL